MLSSLFWVVALILIAGAIVWGLDHLPAIDANFKQVAKVIIIVVVVIIAILIIAGLFGVGPGLPRWR